MRKLIMPLGLLVLVGCGGQGGPAAVVSPQFSVLWPARTRSIVGPESALSGRATFRNVKGQDVVINFNRTSDTTEHTETYNVDQNLFVNTKDFDVTFFANANQSGDIVAEGTAEVTWDDSRMVGTITPSSSIATVEAVTPDQILLDETTTELSFVAKDAEGVNLAVTPGSAKWSILSGESFGSLTPDGVLTPIAEGQVAVRVTLDGKLSPQKDITVFIPPITGLNFGDGYVTGILANGDVLGVSEDWLAHESSAGLWSAQTQTFQKLEFMPQWANPARSPDGSLCYYEGNQMWFSADRSDSGRINLNRDANDWAQPMFATSEVQCGVLQVGLVQHAAWWRGTPESQVNLDPNSTDESGAYACADGIQSGYRRVGGQLRAAMWRGTPESLVDLHPSGSIRSLASATSGEYQGGNVAMGDGIDHAAIWKGSAASYVDLAPETQYVSRVNMMAGRYGVGTLDGDPSIWNVETHARLSISAQVGRGEINVVHLSANGDLLVAGTSGPTVFSARIPKRRLP